MMGCGGPSGFTLILFLPHESSYPLSWMATHCPCGASFLLPWNAREVRPQARDLRRPGLLYHPEWAGAETSGPVL